MFSIDYIGYLIKYSGVLSIFMEANHHSHSSAFAKVENIISEVKDAEKKADVLIERAKKEADELVQSAKHEASTVIRKEEDLFAKEQEKKLSELKDTLAASKVEEAQETAKEISEIKAKAKKNQAKAIAHIIKAFEDKISYE